MKHALTIDVEDYYQVAAFEDIFSRSGWENCESRVERSTELVLRILEQAGVKATFFVLGWTAEHHPGLVRAIAAAGHEIAGHGYDHTLVYRQSPETFRLDIRKTRDILQGITGESVLGYRAPNYSITAATPWALEILGVLA